MYMNRMLRLISGIVGSVVLVLIAAHREVESEVSSHLKSTIPAHMLQNMDPSTPPTDLAELPTFSDTLANSVGLNVNLATLNANDDVEEALLTKSLGVRHIRIPLLRSDPAYDSIVYSFLRTSGTRALGETDCPLPLGFYAGAGIVSADIRAFQNAIHNGLEAYEAVNEPDTRITRDPNWAVDTLSCMKSQVGALPGLPFLAPPIANQNTYAAQLGNVSSLVNRGNFHRYFAGRNPATGGWGGTNACGVYGALTWAECETSLNSRSWPQIITESGYDSVSEVDEPTQAKYLVRELFVNLQARILRTYIYCMNSVPGNGAFAGTGLLEPNLAPKPAFRAIKNIIALFHDTMKPSGSAAVLTYSLLTQTPTIRHALFVRGDGSYLLAIWNETLSWQPIGGGEIPVPPTDVSVSLPFTPSKFSVFALDDNGDFASSDATSSGTSLSFSVDDHVTILSFAK